MDNDDLLGRVGARAGLDLEAAARAVTATFASIGRSLDSLGPLALVDVTTLLPPEFATLVREGASEGGPGNFLAAVAERERTTPGFTKAHAQVVCETFAGMLDERRLLTLRERLPADVAPYFQPYAPPLELSRHTLANGSPASLHPISEPGQAATPDGKPGSQPPLSGRGGSDRGRDR